MHSPKTETEPKPTRKRTILLLLLFDATGAFHFIFVKRLFSRTYAMTPYIADWCVTTRNNTLPIALMRKSCFPSYLLPPTSSSLFPPGQVWRLLPLPSKPTPLQPISHQSKGCPVVRMRKLFALKHHPLSMTQGFRLGVTTI